MAPFPSASHEELSSLFPLTSPIPSPLTHPDILHPSTYQTEADLLANPSFDAWWDHIHTTRRRLALVQQDEQSTLSPLSEDPAGRLLGPLRTKAARLTLQTVTSLYERALAIYPTSFKLWKSYLLFRHSLVLGPAVKSSSSKKESAAAQLKSAKRKLDTAELLDETKKLADWEGGLDGLIGFEEWRSLIATGERCIAWLPNVRSSNVLFLDAHLLKKP